MLGDIFFEAPRLAAMAEEFEAHQAAAVLAVKEEPDPAAIKKNFSIYLRDDGSVRRVIEKPRHLENRLKGCGLYLFDERIFDGIRRTPRTAMRDEYELTDSIQILIDYGYPVRVAPVVEWDMNITYIGDLIACCVFELRKRGLSSLVGQGCSLAPGIELVDTVLGDGVTITRAVRLERCVVLTGTMLDGETGYADAVITPAACLQAGCG
jgi:dTDP-glucose pyrophosphorylase